MKLIRWMKGKNTATGVMIGDAYYDTSAFGEDYDEHFFESDGLARLENFLASNSNSLTRLPENARLTSPVARPSKIICIGLNYADHARETNATPPKEPIIFFKSTTALTGPFDDVIIPKNSQKTDW